MVFITSFSFRLLILFVHCFQQKRKERNKNNKKQFPKHKSRGKADPGPMRRMRRPLCLTPPPLSQKQNKMSFMRCSHQLLRYNRWAGVSGNLLHTIQGILDCFSVFRRNESYVRSGTFQTVPTIRLVTILLLLDRYPRVHLYADHDVPFVRGDMRLPLQADHR